MRRAALLLSGVFGLALVACPKDAPRSDAGAADAGATTASVVPLDAGVGAPFDVPDAEFTSAAGALGAEGTGTPDASTSLRALTDPPKAGTMIDVPGGTFASGSTPGDEGRDPTVEPALVDVAMTAFAIDALPFPNDPAEPPKTGVLREDAARLCSEKGERLCTELEWERACKGSAGDAFATGGAWNAACEKEPAKCASGYGVRAMGSIVEHTDSRFAPSAEGGEGAIVLRGGGHRCAARGRPSRGADAGFRCCKGAANTATVAQPEMHAGFRKTQIDPAALAKIFATIPELSRIGTDVRFFTEGDVKYIQARSGAAHDNITFMTTPILWSPERGADLLVASGRGKSMSFVVALWVTGKDTYRFGSSFLFLNDLSPVALAYDPTHRAELRWSSCWGCAGEQGSVSYRDDHRVVVVQH